MSDETELAVHPTGLDRREFVKRGAIVGGIVWAAPVIHSIGSPAFAFTPLGDGAISYVAFVIEQTATGNLYRVKYEIDGGKWDAEPGQTPHCPEPEHWRDAEKADGGALGIVVSGTSARLCFQLPTGYVFANGGTAMGARGENHPHHPEKGFCTGPDEATKSPTYACFSDPTL